MSKIFVLLLLTLTSTLALRLHGQNDPIPINSVITGGWSTGDPTTPEPQIDAFIRKQFPDLANATLTKTETQVVAGINYKYTYVKDGVTWTVTVWDQSWTKLREVTGIEKVEVKTNPDGKKVQVTSNTRVETRQFVDVAKEYFAPAPA